jgi:hypothetical protein
MARSAKYYNVEDFNNYKRKQEKCLPPRQNVLAAARHIQKLFDAKKFTWGFMGGLAMLCLGYKREMPDLHVAYDDKDFERIISKLEADQRYAYPPSSCLYALIVQNSSTYRREPTPSVQDTRMDWPEVQRSRLHSRCKY